MEWETTADVAEFLATAGAFLRRERARNTVLLTVAETAREQPARYAPAEASGAGDAALSPLFGWWRTDADQPTASARGDGHVPDAVGGDRGGPDGSTIGGAFLHTPPFPVLLSAMPAEAAAVLAARAFAGRPASGVNGNQDAASAFATAWRERTGCRARVFRRMRLYRLGDLAWPDPCPPGAARSATAQDAGLAMAWFAAFAREVEDMGRRDGHGGGMDDDQSAAVNDALGHGALTFWEPDGVPVSMASLTRQVAGMVRVGRVYTPPQQRGRGYGSAVTAAVSRTARADGAEEVLLYTDLANPVSNSIYQRIGYRPVEDRIVLSIAGSSG